MNTDITLTLEDPIYSYKRLMGEEMEKANHAVLSEDGKILHLRYVIHHFSKSGTLADYIKRLFSIRGFNGNFINGAIYEISSEFAVRQHVLEDGSCENHNCRVLLHSLDIVSSMYGSVGQVIVLFTCDIFDNMKTVDAILQMQIQVDEATAALIKVQTNQSITRWLVTTKNSLSRPFRGGLVTK